MKKPTDTALINGAGTVGAAPEPEAYLGAWRPFWSRPAAMSCGL